MKAYDAESLSISIHALHEESDQSANCFQHVVLISIHALHEESDLGESDKQANGEFQSTLSMRRATVVISSHYHYSSNFNPRSP